MILIDVEAPARTFATPLPEDVAFAYWKNLATGSVDPTGHTFSPPALDGLTTSAVNWTAIAVVGMPHDVPP